MASPPPRRRPPRVTFAGVTFAGTAAAGAAAPQPSHILKPSRRPLPAVAVFSCPSGRGRSAPFAAGGPLRALSPPVSVRSGASPDDRRPRHRRPDRIVPNRIVPNRIVPNRIVPNGSSRTESSRTESPRTGSPPAVAPETLRASTRKDLAVLAREHRVSGWHGMRKDELVDALLDVLRSPQRPRLPAAPAAKAARPVKAAPTGRSPQPAAAGASAKGRPAAADAPRGNPGRAGETAGAPRSRGAKNAAPPADPVLDRNPRKDVSTAGTGAQVSEELDAVAHDPHWLHVRWVLKRCTVQRAAAAMGAEWHRATPVLRLFAVHTHETRSTSEEALRDVEVHGGTDHWFLPVDGPPATFRVQLGFTAGDGTFFPLAKSRRVTTPRPGSKAAEHVRLARAGGRAPAVSAAPGLDDDARGDGGRAVAANRPASRDAMFDKFNAVRADYAGAAYGVAADAPHPFTVETELLIRGTAHPDAHVTLSGDTVRVGRDGRFAVKMHLGDGRHVLPAVCKTRGQADQSVVLAVGRGSKAVPGDVTAT